MYSVKPGRGPSLLGGAGAAAGAIFGVLWTSTALAIGAPPVFALFGLVFIAMAVAVAVYHLYNAASRSRMSVFDVTAGAEERDPIAKALGRDHAQRHSPRDGSQEGAGPPGATQPEPKPSGPRQFPGDHCPFCGAVASPDFDYCPKCGNDI
ncbi:MAG TPA: hypothetical protein PKC43_08675 [Phycisphaerales bacterium]|nr:hypothetical protein [Phycisphaerales bacterium]HMP37509.1 hypothetical protein [Phycisphaerales bacterium]